MALVHNGIIENFKPLRDELIADGRKFLSETDSEVVAHLVAREVESGKSPTEAVATVLPRLHGAFAIAFLFKDYPDQDHRRGGRAADRRLRRGRDLGSDALALAPLTQKIAYLEEGDWAVVKRDSIQIYDRANKPVTAKSSVRRLGGADREGHYRHFMQKEIFEQPVVVAQTFQSYVRPFEGKVALPDFDFDLDRQPRHHRRLRHQLLRRHGRQILVRAIRPRPGRHRCGKRVSLPPAGAGAGRAGAVHFAKRRDRRHARGAAPCPRRGQTIAVVVNVPTSSMAREADLPTHAGPEIGVASTKAFTCQLSVLAALAANLARAKGRLSEDEEREIVEHLRKRRRR